MGDQNVPLDLCSLKGTANSITRSGKNRYLPETPRPNLHYSTIWSNLELREHGQNTQQRQMNHLHSFINFISIRVSDSTRFCSPTGHPQQHGALPPLLADLEKWGLLTFDARCDFRACLLVAVQASVASLTRDPGLAVTLPGFPVTRSIAYRANRVTLAFWRKKGKKRACYCVSSELQKRIDNI